MMIEKLLEEALSENRKVYWNDPIEGLRRVMEITGDKLKIGVLKNNEHIEIWNTCLEDYIIDPKPTVQIEATLLINKMYGGHRNPPAYPRYTWELLLFKVPASGFSTEKIVSTRDAYGWVEKKDAEENAREAATLLNINITTVAYC